MNFETLKRTKHITIITIIYCPSVSFWKKWSVIKNHSITKLLCFGVEKKFTEQNVTSAEP